MIQEVTNYGFPMSLYQGAGSHFHQACRTAWSGFSRKANQTLRNVPYTRVWHDESCSGANILRSSTLGVSDAVVMPIWQRKNTLKSSASSGYHVAGKQLEHLSRSRHPKGGVIQKSEFLPRSDAYIGTAPIDDDPICLKSILVEKGP
jgi:hypothetical protein